MDMSKKQEYKFKKSLESIKELKGRGTELISLYIPPDKQIHDVAAYLREEMSQSSNIKSKSTKKHVQGALKSILAKLKYLKNPPKNGIIFFVGHVSTAGDQTDMISESMEPPQPVESFMYRCDSEFYIEPLKNMMGEKKKYGLIVVDRSEATIGLLNGNRVETLKNIQSLVPSKHSKGGQSAQRFERLIEDAAHQYFKNVGGKATDLMLHQELVGILVGGPGRTKDDFVDGGYLHHELEKKVIERFNTGYTDEYGLKELVNTAEDTLSELDVMKEKKLMKRLMEEIKKSDGGLATYGEEHVRRALTMGAVDTLLVSDGIDRVRAEVECDDCGHKEERTIKGPSILPKCPECDSPMEIIEREDLVDELFDLARSLGSDVELISDESEEGELLLNAFGGLAAILRFRVGN